MTTDTDAAVITATAQIVAGFVSADEVTLADLPALFRNVHRIVRGAVQAAGEVPADPQPTRPEPAVLICESVFPDRLISLEDGKPYKSLKRHLRKHGLTPAAYRAKWGLPNSYPMTCADYSAVRSKLAKDAGLGTPAVSRRAAA